MGGIDYIVNTVVYLLRARFMYVEFTWNESIHNSFLPAVVYMQR